MCLLVRNVVHLLSFEIPAAKKIARWEGPHRAQALYYLTTDLGCVFLKIPTRLKKIVNASISLPISSCWSLTTWFNNSSFSKKYDYSCWYRSVWIVTFIFKNWNHKISMPTMTLTTIITLTSPSQHTTWPSHRIDVRCVT